MAVQKNKCSRSKRGMRRLHDRLFYKCSLSVDRESKEMHFRHHITNKGFYKGKNVLIR